MPALPHHLTDLMDRDERLNVLPADLKTVQEFMAKNTFKD